MHACCVGRQCYDPTYGNEFATARGGPQLCGCGLAISLNDVTRVSAKLFLVSRVRQQPADWGVPQSVEWMPVGTKLSSQNGVDDVLHQLSGRREPGSEPFGIVGERG